MSRELRRRREDAAVVGAAHLLHALRVARRRDDGHRADLHPGLGGLAAALDPGTRRFYHQVDDRLYTIYQSMVLFFFENYTGVQVESVECHII
ncbi:AGPAT5: 1-acyl-sn-glycerol-3-phosphate acyltransferase epsilon [Crotalus adamanteus]|uniref:AGPAT5: 1-acyl-sn-glycerol-3-phosphate acyltransferase epsilon n=1 Tax=Crotalus adamanteus TaxID=8729 RepID=A0AAW1CA57_CROAD